MILGSGGAGEAPLEGDATAEAADPAGGARPGEPLRAASAHAVTLGSEGASEASLEADATGEAADPAGDARPGEPRRAPVRRIAAWRHPGLVLLVYAHRAAFGALAAAPLAVHVATLAGGHPRGDGLLFDPGGVWLLEAGRLALPALPALGAQAAGIVVLAAALGLVPLAVLLVGLSAGERLGARATAAQAASRLGTLALLLVTAWAAEGIVAVLILLAGAPAIARLGLDPPGEDRAHVLLVGLALVVVAIFGVVHDLARVACVRRRAGWYSAASMAISVWRRAPLRSTWAWAWRGALGLAALAAALVLHGRLVETAPARVGLSALVHQSAVLFAVAMRASWLAAAMRLVDAHAPEAEGGVR